MARILVVEDSPDIRALVRMLLEADGHEVLTAVDGQQGVTAARQERPDLVLMDLSLPVLSGWEATREIKGNPQTASIPVVAVTAHAMQGDRERALAAGCDGFVAKPIDEEAFGSVVSSFIQGSSQVPGGGPALARVSIGDRARARILVVDDQPDVAELLTSDLDVDDYSVVRASTAGQAESLFRESPAFDLAVVNVHLGSDTGYDLSAQLIASSPEYLPVLLVTAGSIDRERGYAAGAGARDELTADGRYASTSRRAKTTNATAIAAAPHTARVTTENWSVIPAIGGGEPE
jgi:CheY-like chemotaxis protein